MTKTEALTDAPDLFQVLSPAKTATWETYCASCAAFILYPHDKRPAILPRRSFAVDGWRAVYVRPGSLTAINAPDVCQAYACRVERSEA